MNSVNERIRRAREERRLAQTEKLSDPNPTTKSGTKEGTSSQTSSANPKVSRDQASSAAYPRQSKRKNDREELAVNYISHNAMF